jgi:plasmid stabilization system protein ParE
MVHKVRITPEAEVDLRSIGDYIANNANRAQRFVTTLRRQIATPKKVPNSSRKSSRGEVRQG